MKFQNNSNSMRSVFDRIESAFSKENYAVGHFLTLFRMGEGGKATPTSFSPVTSTNVLINQQNFVTFSFNPFVILV